MALKDIPSFESKNKISVNVYQLSKANHIYPVYVTNTECLLKLCDHKLDGDPHLEVNGIRQDDSYTENEEDPIPKHDYPELKKSEIMKNSFQKHEAYSIGFYYHDRYEEDKCFYDKFRGLNCVRKFAERLKEIAIQIQRVSMQKSNIF
ncbi:hypothetical protein QAD02_014212 [Eretmocerus hayati]|uniref:Uncharacterized protein n=1 Tax=Eretmocerus hayati TaxID=131215 RepID=A0ACC2P4U8_9HYME|nr:hypothetical protein QAD02_014212 [Eretmocerus hayati]